MRKIAVRENCYFTHSIVADLVFVLMNIFNKDNDKFMFKDIYEESYIDKLKNRYRFLNEVICSLGLGGTEILEFLLRDNSFNDIEKFKNDILSTEDADFFYRLFGGYVAREDIGLALKSDEGLSKLYSTHRNLSTSYLGLRALFRNKKLFLEELFSCLQDLNTDRVLLKYQSVVGQEMQEFDRTERALSNMDPLSYSESIMGKKFKNRGPYKKFVFVPSYFISINAVRYFEEEQILIYSMNRKKKLSKNDAVGMLKIIADDTRFEIIELLCRNGSMMGKELADSLKLSTATISHHIEQLRKVGFINEERVKNSKYYSINTEARDKFVNYLTENLGLVRETK